MRTTSLAEHLLVVHHARNPEQAGVETDVWTLRYGSSLAEHVQEAAIALDREQESQPSSSERVAAAIRRDPVHWPVMLSQLGDDEETERGEDTYDLVLRKHRNGTYRITGHWTPGLEGPELEIYQQLRADGTPPALARALAQDIEKEPG